MALRSNRKYSTPRINKDFSKIKLFVMDVDGTMTDGKIYMGEQGELMKAFNVKDGLGIKLLMKHDIMPAVITGRTSSIVRERCQELGIPVLYQGVTDKAAKLKELMKSYSYDKEQVAYMGDDMNDLSAIQLAGTTFAPADCASQLVPYIDFVLTKKAGDAPVREAIDMILDGRLTPEDYKGL